MFYQFTLHKNIKIYIIKVHCFIQIIVGFSPEIFNIKYTIRNYNITDIIQTCLYDLNRKVTAKMI